MSRTICGVIRMMLVALLLQCCGVGFAQNNPFGMNDKLYPLYLRARELRLSDKCIPVIDSLQQQAVAMGDRAAELYALNARLMYELGKTENMKGVEAAFVPLIQKSREYRNKQFYVNAVSNKTVYYLMAHRNVDALMYVQELMADAKKSNEQELIRTCYSLYGSIQQYRNQLPDAISLYRKAIDYTRQYLPKYNNASEYVRICDCYRMMDDNENVLKTAEEALGNCKLQVVKNEFITYRCYAHFMLGEYDKFKSDYDYLQQHKTALKSINRKMKNAIDLYKAICDGREADVQKLFKKIKKSSESEYLCMMSAYCAYNKDYENSTKYMREFVLSQYNIDKHVYDWDVENIMDIYHDQNTAKEKQRILNENALLQLENARLSLQNSSLEYADREASSRMARAMADSIALSYKHQHLVTQQLRDSVNRQILLQGINENRLNRHHVLLTSVIVALLIVTLMLLVYSLVKRVLVKRLSVANEKLGASIERLNETKDRAQQSERMKMLFVQNMSHDLRTPLNAIVGFSHMLTDKDVDMAKDDRKRMADYITDNSMLLITLVNDIIDTVALQCGNLKIKPSTVQIGELCRETLETVRHRKQDGVELVYQSDLEDDYAVITDRQRVRQVLINLLTNAEKNTESGSITLQCSLSEDKSRLMFAVADTGVGIPKEKQNEIFNRFSTLSVKSGTGLGLDICRKIASQLDGEVTLDTEYTGGARFLFTIKVKQ